MSSQKNSYKFTLQVIADILSFENSVDALKQKMTSHSIDWEQFVFIASDYLVLTTCYCRLKQKNLVDFIPEDLALYLEEITTINRNRNLTLLKEIECIATLFNDHKINYVFLKGAAFLVKEHFEDFGERMLGDIDILVDESQIETSYQILLNNNYKGTAQGISAKYFDHKHLPRLQSDSKLAAVEIHKKLVIKSYNDVLHVKGILKTKEAVQDIYVPSNEHLLFHSILNFQANDSGYVYSRISFKSIYDLLILNQKYNYNFDDRFKPSYFKNYFSIAKIFFSDFNTFKSNIFINRLFLLKLKYTWLRKTIDYFIENIIFLKAIFTTRIWFFISSKSYRKDIIKAYKRAI
ncbi:MAG: nucleotidyltransferase family protein [Algicola sp.]|nr:nucleotidyltransferase family protein [Algicola sp.]